jgi:WD40 repeat protein
MVQLFRYTNDRFELIQTMDEHVGAVGRLLFANDGERLLSCSADRTVVIRDRMIREADDERTAAFILSKVITLKASPVSMTIPSDDPDGLVISTIDRQIHKFNIPSARNIHSFC